MLAVTAALHDALGVQHPELLRERGELGLARFSELGDAALSRVEPVQESQARCSTSVDEVRTVVMGMQLVA